ncbi:MAG: S9 family peptidase [Planctomycetes bacterium]|nr:S9 family peptidase [Planctomycetota bacterium]
MIETGGEAWEYVATVRSAKDSPLTIYYESRDQKDAALYRLDPETAQLTELLREHDDAWVNIDADMPRWTKDGGGFLWTSERSGDRKLELRRTDGTLVREFELKTKDGDSARYGGFVAMFDQESLMIVKGGVSSIESHLFGLELDGTGCTDMSGAKGVFGAIFSKNGDTRVITGSLANGKQLQTLCRQDDHEVMELPSLAVDPTIMPNVEWTTVTIELRRHEVAILRPRDFKKGRKYPVIESVYGGPGSSVVTTAARAYLRNQWMADQGFIVVQTDARGTPGRGRDWERAISGNVIDIPLSEHADIVKALCAQYPEMDASRVGITGWSFGGYFSAMAVLKRPDVYKAAVAGAPVTDWHDYDTHYTERYMGMPDANAAGYKACDASTYADQLSRPLLLIHGTTDDNVYFQHTLKLHDALFRAGKKHELLMLSGFTHMVPDPNVSMRLYERIVRFFKTEM